MAWNRLFIMSSNNEERSGSSCSTVLWKTDLAYSSGMQERAEQTVQERPPPGTPLPQPDADESDAADGKKKRERRKAADKRPKAAASRKKAGSATQAVPQEGERLVIGRFKDALTKQRTAEEANKVCLAFLDIRDRVSW